MRQAEKQKVDEKVAAVNEEIAATEREGATALSYGQIGLVQSVMNTANRLKLERAAAVKEQIVACQNLIEATQAVAQAQSELQIVDKHIDREKRTHRRLQLNEEENTRQENTARRHSRRPSAITTSDGKSETGDGNTRADQRIEVTS